MRQRWRLLAFIGILMCMGIVRQSVTEHFRIPQDGEIDLRIPAIRAWGLSQLEFEQIMRYLHFADNTAIDVGEDRAAKVRPLLKEGWLHKKGFTRHNWKKRWFCLLGYMM